jgi:aerobic C4-dicarboxylate transport protein
VARWEGQLDADRMRKVLRGEQVDPLDDEAEPQKEPALR